MIGTRISSPGFPVENGGDGFCKVQCIGGRTCLVEDHIDLRLLSGKLQHGAAEVLSIFAIKPCRTYDKMVYTRIANSLFSAQFRMSIHSRGSSLLFLGAWCIVGLQSEDIIGTDVHQKSAHLTHGLCQDGRSQGIDTLGSSSQDRVCLACIHVGPGSTVDNDFHLSAVDNALHCCPVGDVQQYGIQSFCRHGVGKYILMAAIQCCPSHFSAQLSIGACYQNIHILPSLSFVFDYYS